MRSALQPDTSASAAQSATIIEDRNPNLGTDMALDIVIMAAAVADYRPVAPEPGKRSDYAEHLRVPDMSIGTYSIPARGHDGQTPHGEDEIYADIGLGDAFERLPAITAAQHKIILKRTAKALADGKPAPAR